MHASLAAGYRVYGTALIQHFILNLAIWIALAAVFGFFKLGERAYVLVTIVALLAVAAYTFQRRFRAVDSPTGLILPRWLYLVPALSTVWVSIALANAGPEPVAIKTSTLPLVLLFLGFSLAYQNILFAHVLGRAEPHESKAV